MGPIFHAIIMFFREREIGRVIDIYGHNNSIIVKMCIIDLHIIRFHLSLFLKNVFIPKSNFREKLVIR